MKKIFGYVKPFAFTLVVCVVLLFVQAMCDLNLPNYMSKIVNVGLQQSGIETASPSALSSDGYKLVSLFMDQEDKLLLERNYTLVAPQEASKDQIKKYPLLKEESIYILKEKSEEGLDLVFGHASMALINHLKTMGNQGSDQKMDMSTMDFTKLYEMIPMLEQLPAGSLDKAIEEAKKTDESLLSQTGTAFTKLFYQELGMDLSKMQSQYIIKIGAIMLLISLLGAAASVSVGYGASRLSAGLARNLRKDLFAKVEGFSHNEIKNFGASSLITRTTNDISQVQNLFVMGIRMICYAPVMGIGGIIMAVNKSNSMSWIIAVAVIVLIGLIVCIFSVAMPKFKSMQKLIDKLNLVARENLNGMLVIRAFGTQKFEENRFDQANRDFAKTNLFVNKVMVLMMPIMTLIMNGVTLLIVWVGAHQIENAAMQVGDMMAFMQYAMQIIMSFLMISMMFIMVPRASVSASRIAEILNTDSTIKDPKQPKKFIPEVKGVVEFNHVSFHYRDAEEDVLHDISFKAMPGQTTAFIGSTGSGKSTLIDLIPRFYDVTEGSVKVSGIDVKEASLHELREHIGYVPQKGVLLSGTIDSNIRYGVEKATAEEISEAIEVAQAKDFIAEKEKGLDSPIAQGGGNVSGGQKQRLSIARALAKRPDVYIFDDSFSALDFKTDAKLRAALKGYTKESTVLIVAQRVSSIMQAEQIIVLEEGRIVGMGTHQELLKNCPTYYEIASSQLSKEELA